MRLETKGHFLVGTVILGFLTIYKKRQASSTFEALNTVCLSMCQRNVRPIVAKRERPRAFCRVSIGDSDILSSCAMNDEPALSLCREIWPSFKSGISGSISLEAEITGSFSIHIPEGKLDLRRLWKVGLPLQSKTGNKLSSPDDMRCMQLSSRFFTETDVPLDFRWMSQGISGFY